MQIRTGMRSSWLAATAAVLVTGLLAFLPSGCGGSGGTVVGPTPTPAGATPTPTPLRTANFKVQIDWGARSRVTGLSSALSARITLENGDPAGGNITWVENRPAGTAAASQVYTSPKPAKVGNFVLSVKFFSEAAGAGVEVGEAKASATVLADGSLTVTISTYTGIQTVELLAGQSVAVGEEKALDFTAKDAKGTIVAVPPTIPDSFRGAVFFTVVSQTQNLSSVSNGSKVRGLHPSDAVVTATIDNATSTAALVKVTSQTDIAITQNPVNGATNLGSEFPLDLSAVVTDSNAPAGEKGVVWSIVGGASALNGSLINVQENSVTYVAPYLIRNETRDIVVKATSKYNPDKSVTIPVHVIAPATVVITPSPVSISWEQSVDLNAVVNNLSPRIPATGDSRREVKWEIVKDGVNPVGVFVLDPANANHITYTAPKRDATITIQAVSNYDSTTIGTVTINVLRAVAVNVVSPSPLASPLKISVKRTQDFGVSLINIPPGKDGSVSWTVTGPAGEPNTGNVYGTVTSLTTTTARYTAPATQPGTGLARVIATSNYDTNASKVIDVQIVGGSLGIGIN